ncbi:MAG: hypothetical protein GC204_05635 [Chloroflexi bacterium]|nr:hypothetical protein [Chloroflexota bacterium]
MKTFLKLQNNDALFVIQDLAPAYHQAAHDLYFQPIDGEFAKIFPASTPQLERIFQNFESSAEAMIGQTAGELAVDWENELEDFLGRIQDQDLNWYLVGSAALAVRGIQVQPRDLDIVVGDDSSVERLRDLLLDVTVEPFARSQNWIAGWFGRIFNRARLEVVGVVLPTVDAQGICDFGPAAAARLEKVMWRGWSIRVPPLDLMLAVTEQRGLHERAEAIRTWQVERATG